MRGLAAGWMPAQMVRFLEIGLTPKGTHPRPPMPAFGYGPRRRKP